MKNITKTKRKLVASTRISGKGEIAKSNKNFQAKVTSETIISKSEKARRKLENLFTN